MVSVLVTVGWSATSTPFEVAAQTFTVTSTSCSGPGSIVEAIEQANASPGPDTITITPGLQIGPVSANQCGVATSADPSNFYLATVTGDVTISGQGVRIWGNQKWVSPDGNTFNAGKCPGPLDTIVSTSPGFARVDGAGLAVEGITFENLSAFARLSTGSRLELQETRLVRIFDFYNTAGGTCSRPPIDGPEGDVTIAIVNSQFVETFNAEKDIGPVVPPFDDQPVVWGSPTIAGQGTLTIDRSLFGFNKGVAQWRGGSVDVVSSRFGESSGWINARGATTTVNIVNSALQGGLPGGWNEHARIIADTSSTVNINASTLVVGFSDCPPRPTPQIPDAQCIGGPGVIQSKRGSTVNLSQSAIGIQVDAGVPALVNFGGTTNSGTITADASTWVQPLPGATPPQTAADLEAITGQPLLLTAAPGLPQRAVRWPDSHVPLLGDTATPGVLVDVIENANCGNTNQLLSPLDNSCITTDVLGNPRWDTGNNRRNIGAIQNTLAPHLAVLGVGDGTVELGWNELFVESPAVTGYAVLYRLAGTSDPLTRVDVAGSSTVNTAITGLVNGATYEFEVVGVSANGDGPPSNRVTATPSTVPGTPIVTVTPGDGQVGVTWTEPTDGGAPIQGYLVQYRPVGSTDWQTWPFQGPGSSTTITGLTNGTAYEFRTAATNRNGDGPFGPTAQATPTATTTPTSTTPTTSPTPTTPTTSPATTTIAPTLPETGSETQHLGIVAATLAAVGAALVLATRRRPTSNAARRDPASKSA